MWMFGLWAIGPGGEEKEAALADGGEEGLRRCPDITHGGGEEADGAEAGIEGGTQNGFLAGTDAGCNDDGPLVFATLQESGLLLLECCRQDTARDAYRQKLGFVNQELIPHCFHA